MKKALVGVVLDHYACGAHLDDNGYTTNIELEKENFIVAGKVLADVWSKLKLDERSVIAEYGENKQCCWDDADELWVSEHCRILQYMLQIVKFNDINCSGEMQSVWKDVFPKRFLAAQVKMRQAGPQVLLTNNEKASVNFTNFGIRMLLDKIIGIPSMPHD